jgi:hypothetical protein
MIEGEYSNIDLKKLNGLFAIDMNSRKNGTDLKTSRLRMPVN